MLYKTVDILASADGARTRAQLVAQRSIADAAARGDNRIDDYNSSIQ